VTDNPSGAIAQLIIRVSAVCVVLRNAVKARVKISYKCWWGGRVSLYKRISSHDCSVDGCDKHRCRSGDCRM
jgi:hypothetical protein